MFASCMKSITILLVLFLCYIHLQSYIVNAHEIINFKTPLTEQLQSFNNRNQRNRQQKCQNFQKNFSLDSIKNDTKATFDYGRELLLHDIITRKENTSILETPFYIQGHCAAPFSQSSLLALSALGLGVTDEGLTVTCSSLNDCEECYNVTGCHWCQDNNCHTMGSFYGCIYGASCEGEKDPCLRKTSEYRGVKTASFSTLLLISCVGIVFFGFIWLCLYIGFVCGLSPYEKMYQDEFLPFVSGTFSSNDHADQDTRNNEVIMMNELHSINSAAASYNPNSLSPASQYFNMDSIENTYNMRVYGGDAVESKESMSQDKDIYNYSKKSHVITPSINVGASYSPTTPLSATLIENQNSVGLSAYNYQNMLPAPTMVRVVGKNKCCSSIINTFYNAGRCEKFAIYKLLVLIAGIISAVAIILAMIMFPAAPEMSICNKTIKWGSIFEYIINYKVGAKLDIQLSLYNPNRFGLDIHAMSSNFLYKGKKIGSANMTSTSIVPGSVQDIMILTEINPSLPIALEMLDDYSNENLFLDLDMKFDTNLRFWDIPLPRFNASYSYNDMDMQKEEQRLYCLCP